MSVRRGFDTAIAMLVFLNVIVMSTEHIGMSTTHEENIEVNSPLATLFDCF